MENGGSADVGPPLSRSCPLGSTWHGLAAHMNEN
eukprot:SAG31_NODE_14900_length_781_cov_1.947214_1_plen_33_part_10